MDIGVPSRFACLNIEDDENRKASSTNVKKPKNVKKPAKKPTTVSALPKQNTSVSNKTKQKHKKESEKQWEEWKRKDSEFVDDNYEQDLQDAILQSKMDFEANKRVKNDSNLKLVSTENGAKKKKAKTMNLSEFLGQASNLESQNETVNGRGDEKKGDEFFERMLIAAELEVAKSKIEEQRKERDGNFEKTITIAQYQEKLEEERAHSRDLQRQLDEAKAEIVSVKVRNKTLCSILAQGEMRDKAEVLLELERLNTVKDELTDEVSHLHELLEQERSKITVSYNDNNHQTKPKDKIKRKKT